MQASITKLNKELAKAFNNKQKARQEYAQAKYVVSRLEEDVDDTMYNLAIKEEEKKRIAYRAQVKLYA